MLYTNPQVPPSELWRFYPPTYAAHQGLDAPHRRMRHKDVWDRLEPRGQNRLLDVGCGDGGYLLRQRSRGWTVTGIEPSASAVAVARQRGLEVFEGVLPGVDLAGRQFDVITLLGVLDHVPEPQRTLEAVRELLSPGGIVVISVPNAESAAARVFGEAWPGWDLPRHQNHFTPDTLRQMLQRAGLSPVEMHGRRRPSRWRQGARIKSSRETSHCWKWLARSKPLCRLVSLILSGRSGQDEIVSISRRNDPLGSS